MNISIYNSKTKIHSRIQELFEKITNTDFSITDNTWKLKDFAEYINITISDVPTVRSDKRHELFDTISYTPYERPRIVIYRQNVKRIALKANIDYYNTMAFAYALSLGEAFVYSWPLITLRGKLPKSAEISATLATLFALHLLKSDDKDLQNVIESAQHYIKNTSSHELQYSGMALGLWMFENMLSKDTLAMVEEYRKILHIDHSDTLIEVNEHIKDIETQESYKELVEKIKSIIESSKTLSPEIIMTTEGTQRIENTLLSNAKNVKRLLVGEQFDVSANSKALSYCKNLNVSLTIGRKLLRARKPTDARYEVPQGVTKIASFAFCNEKLKEIILHDKVVEADINAFAKCPNLQQRIENTHTIFRIHNLPAEQKELVIDEPKTIGRYAVASNDNLESIKVGKKVTQIKARAFCMCKGLKHIELPDDIEGFPDGLLAGCTSLETIDIPSSVKKIGPYAFSNCTGLKNVTIPDGVEEIGTCTFKKCLALEKVSLPASIKSIHPSAFLDANPNTIVEIRNSHGASQTMTIDKATSWHIPNSNYIDLRNCLKNIKSHAINSLTDEDYDKLIESIAGSAEIHDLYQDNEDRLKTMVSEILQELSAKHLVTGGFNKLYKTAFPDSDDKEADRMRKRSDIPPQKLSIHIEDILTNNGIDGQKPYSIYVDKLIELTKANKRNQQAIKTVFDDNEIATDLIKKATKGFDGGFDRNLFLRIIGQLKEYGIVQSSKKDIAEHLFGKTKLADEIKTLDKTYPKIKEVRNEYLGK